DRHTDTEHYIYRLVADVYKIVNDGLRITLEGDIVEGSICIRDDCLAIGDQITEVNDQSFNEFSNVEALYLL
ncbi:unnamed protein product, partial [Rotaria sp. Silwood1]